MGAGGREASKESWVWRLGFSSPWGAAYIRHTRNDYFAQRSAVGITANATAPAEAERTHIAETPGSHFHVGP